MKEYRSKDFYRKEQADTLLWVSKDLKFTITTTTNPFSQYFVYVNLGTTDEWVGIQEDSLDDAIEKLNEMIIEGTIDKYLI